MSDEAQGSFAEVFRAFLRLGLTSFGGPIAHLGYFHAELVVRRRWISEEAYADLVALCQFLPGPASSQVGMGIGFRRARMPGLLAAFLGFTLPSAMLMIGFAYGIGAGDVSQSGWLRGLELAAVAIVAQAVWTMATKLCLDRYRATLALMAAIAVLGSPSPSGQIAVIFLGALCGWLLFQPVSPFTRKTNALGRMESPPSVAAAVVDLSRPLSRALGVWSLTAFFVMLLGLPILATVLPGIPGLRVFAGFYQAGSLVFGGGHVVLPLLQAQTVEKGLITNGRFLAGYGAVQAVPGPLFTFAGYLGAVLRAPEPHGWAGGLLCLAAIFLPASLLIIGVLPFWESVRRQSGAQAALSGANASVVGVLLAALYRPIWTSAVHGPLDFSIALGAYGLLVFWRLPPWLVVCLAATGGALLLR